MGIFYQGKNISRREKNQEKWLCPFEKYSCYASDPCPPPHPPKRGCKKSSLRAFELPLSTGQHQLCHRNVFNRTVDNVANPSPFSEYLCLECMCKKFHTKLGIVKISYKSNSSKCIHVEYVPSGLKKWGHLGPISLMFNDSR